tara:strand:- start:722 stop:1006 length:285 start_codon:yes stop_codon:yes gene_type:complete
MLQTQTEVMDVQVHTTNNKGHDPQFWVDRVMERLLSVSENADPIVKEQAKAFKDSIQALLLFYIKQAIKSDRSTVAGLLDKQGHKDMADIIRRL